MIKVVNLRTKKKRITIARNQIVMGELYPLQMTAI